MPKVLVVDLDGTLLKGDVSVERLWRSLSSPRVFCGAILILLSRGRAASKAYLERYVPLDLESIPRNRTVEELMAEKKRDGYLVALVSGSPEKTVKHFASQYPVFDFSAGSSADRNLTGVSKLSLLQSEFPAGFEYVGDSARDRVIWRAAASAFTVNRRFAREAVYLPQEQEQSCPLVREMRLRHWSKNLLVSVPLVLEAPQSGFADFWAVVVAFLALSFVASGTYIFNDIRDISADRSHATKRLRPLAAGQVSIPTAGVASGFLILIGLLLGVHASPETGVAIAVYLCISVAYSSWLKIAMVDLVVLSALFVLRLVIGSLAVGAPPSIWLYGFAFFLFLSLASAKRSTEVRHEDNLDSTRSTYSKDDLSWLESLGLGSALISVSLLLNYLVASGLAGSYVTWVTAPLLLIAMIMVWKKTKSGRDMEDPIDAIFRSIPILSLLIIVVLVIVMAKWGV